MQTFGRYCPRVASSHALDFPIILNIKLIHSFGGDYSIMAECIRFVCSSCQKSIEAWSDGNPFYIDENGKKKYAYHPDHEELEKCIANDLPYLCLDCGQQVKIDSRKRTKNCPDCMSANVADTFSLEGVTCPMCDDGHFVRDSKFYCIS